MVHCLFLVISTLVLTQSLTRTRLCWNHKFSAMDAHFFETDANKNLLMELCVCCHLIVGKSFFPQPQNKQVTCYNVGANPYSEINPTNFGQLDFLLLHQNWLACISQLHSRMGMPLASHHFPVIAELTLHIPHASSQQRGSAFNSASLLNEPSLQNQFACLVRESMLDSVGDVTAPHTADTLCSQLARSLHVAAKKCLPRRFKRPRMSGTTLALLERRVVARQRRDLVIEKQLNLQIKQSVRRDRTAWLDSLLHTGDWNEIRKLRKGASRRLGRLRDQAGTLKSSDEKAETFANFLASTRWAVRPVSFNVSGTSLGSTLPISCLNISRTEVVEAARKLKRGKACGQDGLPPEFWKCTCRIDSPACVWAVALCNRVWNHADVATDWHKTLIQPTVRIKGPFHCLLCKLLAAILLRRLIGGGAESKIWHTQVGFRSGRGTTHAVFVARRLLDHAVYHKDDQLVFLALDWSKAFDSVDPKQQVPCPHSFWYSAKFCDAVGAVDKDRQFTVRDFHPHLRHSPTTFRHFAKVSLVAVFVFNSDDGVVV